MKYLAIILPLLTSCTQTHLDRLNEVRKTLEPLTDANCVVVGMFIQPELVPITQELCNVIKSSRTILDGVQQ